MSPRPFVLFTAVAASAVLLLATPVRRAAAQSSTGSPALPNAPSAIPDDPSLPDYGLSHAGALSGSEKAKYAVRHTFGPGQFVGPAIAAGILMATPKDHYPPEWRQGGGAYGRLYGASLAQNTAADGGRYLTGFVLHEDPRYFPSEDRRPLQRVMHAVLFTLIDRSDSGNRRLAISSFAGAASGGFIGNAYLPDGNFTERRNGQLVTVRANYADAVHGGQRSAVQLGSFAANNITREFDPEIRALARKLHLPVIR